MERILQILLVLLIALIAKYAPAKEPPKGASDATTATTAQSFRWFDTLAYPTFRDHRFVSVELQRSIELDVNPASRSNTYGFLLSEDELQFRVLRLDLSQQEFEKPVNGTRQMWPATYRIADIERVADERLQKLSESGDSTAKHTHPLGYSMRERTQLFVLARASDALGHPQLARKLIERAIDLPDYRTGEGLTIDRFQSEISDHIGHVETWRSFVAFGDPQVSREELLRRFRWIAEHFSDSRHSERVNSTIAVLEKMVKEDRKHAAKNLPPLEEMPVKQRVEELIFQLRDQNGQQFSQPGSCDIFSDPRDGGLLGAANERGAGSPATQLVAIGRPALGQLIDSVDDEQFTRCVEYHRSFCFSHHVIRVGQCCLEIMNRINPTGRVWDSEKDREKAKREMKTWYLGKSVNN